MTAVKSISAVIIFKICGLLLVMVQGAQFGIFEVPENKSLSELFNDVYGGGLETVFIFKFDPTEESL